MTFAELKAALDKLTPEQLELTVLWCGDDRGGEIDSLGFADEDTIEEAESGELYPRSEYEDIFPDAMTRPEHRVVGEKGTPLLFTDGVA